MDDKASDAPSQENAFRPYVSAAEHPREFSVTAVIVGIFLAVVFGVANAYLGLRVGMTIAASIPAAVLSMLILRVFLRRNSILENNVVQTIASAGESLAAGAIFTMPVFFLWADEGVAESPPFSTLTLLALFGGVLGVLFMIPLRRYLIVKEDKKLIFPEGRACAEVLLVGEKNSDGGARFIFWGAGVGVLMKLILDGWRICASRIALALPKLHTELGMEPYPALFGVGYICGLRTAAMLCAGSILSWLVLIPSIVYFGNNTAVSELYAQDGAMSIWSSYIRYIGAGAVAAGGVFGLIKALPVIFVSFVNSIRGIGKGVQSVERTDKDIDPRIQIALIVVIFALLCALPQIPLNTLGIFLFMACGFFFAVVASRIVGVIGSSNCPCSGMTIAALLVSAFILKKAGVSGAAGMIAALSIATMCCVITCIASDISQDLKTGYLIGGTPWKMQLGEIIGILVTSVCVGGVLLLLHRAWGFGSSQIPAPQAHLMKLVTEGVMQDTMSWTLIAIGCCISLAMEFLGISSLCVAIGVFLPFSLTSMILVGGIAQQLIFMLKKANPQNGVLFSSGLIAGEGLTGIVLAGFAVAHLSDWMDVSARFSAGSTGSVVLSIALFVVLIGLCFIPKKR